MVAQFEVLFAQTEGEEEVLAVVLPVLEPLEVGSGLAEEFKLHLFELAGPEREVARRDLVSEGFAYLTYAEGDLFSGRSLNVLKVYEYTLSRLRPEVYLARRILGNALEGLKHQVELSYIGEIMLAAVGTSYVVLFYIVEHFLIRPAVGGNARRVLYELIGSESGLTLLTVHKRIRKAAHVSGRHPRFGVHQDRRVESHVVRALLDEFFPPRLFDVVLELDAERAVVPGVGESAVYLRAGVYEAPALA